MLTSAILVATSDRADRSIDGSALGRDHSPPALTPVLGRPLVAHAVDDLLDFGVGHVVVLVDEGSEQGVTEACRELPAGTASVDLMCRDPRLDLPAAIAAARLALGHGPFLLRFADCIGRAPLREQIDGVALGDFDAMALMARFRGSESPPPQNGSGQESPMSEFHVGVFALGAGFPSAYVTPETTSTPWMDSALEWMERRGGAVERRHVGEWWRHRGGPGAILGANSFMLEGLAAEAVEAEVVESSIDGAVICHPTARIESSIVRGPVAIGAGAVIKHSFVGPFTSIGDDVRIDGAEIENSVVLEGSVVSNVGGRLDSSVIGPRATITKDFRMPRGTRLDVGPGASVSFP